MEAQRQVERLVRRQKEQSPRGVPAIEIMFMVLGAGDCLFEKK